MLKKYGEYIKEEAKKREEVKLPDLTTEEQKVCDEALEFFKPIIDWNKKHGEGRRKDKSEILSINFLYVPEFYIPTSILNGTLDIITEHPTVKVGSIKSHNIKVDSYKRLILFYNKVKDKIKFPPDFNVFLDLTTYLEDNLESHLVSLKCITYNPNNLNNPKFKILICPTLDSQDVDDLDGYYTNRLNLDDLSLISSEIKKIATKYNMVKCESYSGEDGSGFEFEFEIL